MFHYIVNSSFIPYGDVALWSRIVRIHTTESLLNIQSMMFIMLIHVAFWAFTLNSVLIGYNQPKQWMTFHSIWNFRYRIKSFCGEWNLTFLIRFWTERGGYPPSRLKSGLKFNFHPLASWQFCNLNLEHFPDIHGKSSNVRMWWMK